MTTHYNYVAYFPRSRRLKVGITSNPERRAREYRQEANRHGLGLVAFFRGHAQYKGVARLVEQSIRDSLRCAVIKNHYEWFAGDRETLTAFLEMTVRIQDEVQALLHVETANA